MVKASNDMKLSYLIREMVWTSTLHFHDVDMDMKNHAWVLMNWDIEIKRMPQYPKEYSFATEAIGSYRFYAARDFKIFDGDELIVYGKSLWTIIDLEKRSLAAIPDEIAHLFKEVDRTKIKDYQFKLPKLEGIESKKISIKNEDIDGNGHVSNAVYLKWFENIFDYEKYVNIEYKNIKVIYKKEILPNENIGYRKIIENSLAKFDIINLDNEELKASILAEF